MSLGWKLNRPQFFEQFKTSGTRPGSGSGGNKPESLGYICDDVFFLWRSSTKTIVKAVCSDIWRNDTKIPSSHQEVSLSSPIPFNVSNLHVQKRSSRERCLLWGPSGIAVVTIPFTMGSSKGGLVAECEVLGERIYVEHSRLAIMQAKWHPTSTKDIAVVLNNDYFIRCYDLEDPSTSFSVICAGPSSSVPFNYTQLSVGLSEPPVDFDFGPELPESGQWTIFLLKSSGTLSYIQMKIIEATRRVHWEPEKLVTVHGVFEDVFELPTTLSVSRGFPTVVTIGSLSGKLYHSVLLPSDTEAYDSVNMESAILGGETTLYVKEVLELESEAQLSYVKLIPDPLCSYRYACVHEGGIHVITMNFVPYMLGLLRGKTEHEEVDTTSSCRYVLCCMDDRKKKHILSSSTFSNSLPQKFVTITEAGETLVYDIPRYPTLGSRSATDSQVPTTNAYSSSVQVIPDLKALESVTSLLNKTVNQPYLAVSEDLSPEKRENILMESIRTLEQEYIQKQEEAIEFLSVTLSYLLEKVDDLAEPLNALVDLQPMLRETAEEIAVTYEEENEVEESLSRRLDVVLLEHQKALPVMTDAEKVWLRKLEQLQEEVEHLKEQVDGLKGKITGTQAQLIPADPNPHGFKERKPYLSSHELLRIKKEIMEHQRDLVELTASFQQMEASMAN